MKDGIIKDKEIIANAFKKNLFLSINRNRIIYCKFKIDDRNIMIKK